MRAGVASAVLVAWLAVLAPSHALAPADGASADLGASETASPWFCHGLDVRRSRWSAGATGTTCAPTPPA